MLIEMNRFFTREEVKRHYRIPGDVLPTVMAAVPVVFVSRVENLWVAVLLVGLAAAAHSGFAANLFTIVSDTVPRKAVGSVVGIGGTAGSAGMLWLAPLVGLVLDWTKKVYGAEDYLVPFIIAGSSYLVATLLIHLLLPRLEPMIIDDGQSADINA